MANLLVMTENLSLLRRSECNNNNNPEVDLKGVQSKLLGLKNLQIRSEMVGRHVDNASNKYSSGSGWQRAGRSRTRRFGTVASQVMLGVGNIRDCHFKPFRSRPFYFF